MSKRKAISAETLMRVAGENAGHPIDAERASAYAEAFEPILQLLDNLRELPLKDVEPAMIFKPEEIDE